MNSVRLYSNGTAVISREYAFTDLEPLRISIPVRKTDLDDVVSSLTVFGDVTVTEPPTYTPTNAEQLTLELKPTTVLRDLITKLAGAAVEVEAGSAYMGTLVGLQPYWCVVKGNTFEQWRIVVSTAKGIQQVEEASVTALRFTDPLVQAEIDKSLRASLAQIKPDSSKVELTVRPNPGASAAIVTYATPVAAWKIRYQIRLTDAGTELEGQAIVDNDTDDDWSETAITVITGEPITFATDLAEIRRPARSRVNIVSEFAIGAVVAEPEMPVATEPSYASITRGGGYGGGGGSPARMSRAALGGTLRDATPVRAKQTEAETHESGDFSLFTSPEPVSIGAGRSAIIPLFQTAVAEARVLLLYKEKDDPERPFRAVRFRNPAAHALGRGVCEVFVGADFQGKCLLEATKPGAETLLVHARETGVRVFKKANKPETRRLAIRIATGVIVNEVLHRQRTSYRVQNSHPEPFVLEIEHPRSRADSDITIRVADGSHEEAEIPSGRRIRVTLSASGALEVQVVEEQVETQEIGLNVSWLIGNVISMKAPTAHDAGVQECVALQGKIDGIDAEIRVAIEQTATLADEQERLIKLIPNGHAEQANAWRTDLADAETQLRAVKRSVLPQLRGQLKEAQDALGAALARLQYTWIDSAKREG